MKLEPFLAEDPETGAQGLVDASSRWKRREIKLRLRDRRYEVRSSFKKSGTKPILKASIVAVSSPRSSR